MWTFTRFCPVPRLFSLHPLPGHSCSFCSHPCVDDSQHLQCQPFPNPRSTSAARSTSHSNPNSTKLIVTLCPQNQFLLVSSASQSGSFFLAQHTSPATAGIASKSIFSISTSTFYFYTLLFLTWAIPVTFYLVLLNSRIFPFCFT